MRYVHIKGRGVYHVAHDQSPTHSGRIRTLCRGIRKNFGNRYVVSVDPPKGKRPCLDCQRRLETSSVDGRHTP